jgi:hypothetical protein
MSEQSTKPSIRCPSCGNDVILPAEICPQCSYNFRTGIKPPPKANEASPQGGSLEESESRKKYYIIGAIAALVLIIILAFAFSGSKEEEQTAAPQGTVLQPAPSLSDSPLMHPERPIGAARNAADAVEQRQDTMEDIHEGAK